VEGGVNCLPVSNNTAYMHNIQCFFSIAFVSRMNTRVFCASETVP
jgi:hypothetical protein